MKGHYLKAIICLVMCLLVVTIILNFHGLADTYEEIDVGICPEGCDDYMETVQDYINEDNELKSDTDITIGEVELVDAIEQYGVTWYFDKAYQCGRFANGDYWVKIDDNTGTVIVTNITPEVEYNYVNGGEGICEGGSRGCNACAAFCIENAGAESGSACTGDSRGTGECVCSYIRNGWEVNPVYEGGQRFDNRINGPDASLVPALPYTAQGSQSLVKVVSKDTSGPDGRESLQKAVVLTVVDTIPPDNGESVFRPPYTGTDKPYYSINDLHLDLLPSFTMPEGSSFSLDWVRQRYEMVQLDHKSGVQGRALHAEDNYGVGDYYDDYGGAIGRDNGRSCVRLMLNDPIDEKMPALIAFVQYGIDLYAMMLDGNLWGGGGGHRPGQPLPICFASVLLGDQEMKMEISKRTHLFHEYTTLSYSPIADNGNGKVLFGVPGSDVSYWEAIVNNYYGYTTGNRSDRDPYGYIDGSYTIPGHYQHCCTSQPWKGSVLAVHLMPELRPVFNNEIVIKYVERWVNEGTFTQPDPCAPIDGIISGGPKDGQHCTMSSDWGDGGKCIFDWDNYGKTYGPDRDNPGMCIQDTDISDGIGRWPHRHNISVDGGSGAYRSAFIDLMWDEYRYVNDKEDNEAPQKPADLKATVLSENEITLEWTASTDNEAVIGYRIYRNGEEIDTIGFPGYSDSNIVETETYTYTVTAYDAAGNESEHSEEVTVSSVEFPPTILKHPLSTTAAVGDDISFSVKVNASPVPDYQWQKKEQNGFVDIPEATEAALGIEDVQAEDAGEYRVVVTNTKGTEESNPATLTIVEIPAVPEISGIAEFYSVYLFWENPTGQGNSWDKTIVVRKKGERPEAHQDGIVVFDGSRNSYIDRDLSKGIYYYAIFTYKEYPTDAVYSAPTYTAQIKIPEEYNKDSLVIRPGSEGKHIVIGQNTEGDLYSLWNTSSNVIGKGPGGNKTGLWVYSDIVGTGNNQLPTNSKIVSARLVFNVEGFKQISVENFAQIEDESGNSSDISNKAHTISIYQIKDPENLGMPEFAEKSGIRVGLDYMFRDHRPGVNIPWVINISENNGNVDTYANVNTNDDIDTNINADTNINTDIMNLLKGVNPVDEVKFNPEVYQDGLAKAIQFDITEAVQAWVDGENEQGLFITIGEDWVDGESLKLSGISSEEESSRPYIEIIYGTDDGSVDLTPPAPVKNLNITPDSDNITLSWDNPDDNDLVGVKIIRREGMIPFSCQDEGATTYVARNINNYSDNDLETGKTYFYALFTYDNQQNYSRKVWTKAIPGSPTEVQNLNVNDNCSGVVGLSWDSLSDISGYNIYRSDGTEEGELEDIQLIAHIEQEQIQFIDYVLAGEYTYRVSAVNENGEGPLSTGKTITISESAEKKPTAPTSFAGIAISGSEIELNWSDSPDETGYVLERKGVDESWENGLVIAELNLDVVKYIDSSLLPDTGYMYRIKAVNMAVESDYTSTDTILTSNEPVAVKNINWEVISASQIKVTWEDTPNEESYQLKLYRDGNELETVDISGNRTSCYFVTLEPGKEYRVQIVSVNSSGSTGILSDIIRTSADAKGGLF